MNEPDRLQEDGPPLGTVTFLLTDIERSTALWQETGEAFKTALQIHHATLRQTFRRHGGHEFKEIGDGFRVAFAAASDALRCAIACQRALAAQSWLEPIGALRVRMALHTGDAEYENGDYRSLALHHAQRIQDAAHGGQILLSEATAAVVRRDLPAGVELIDLGRFRLRDLTGGAHLFQVNYVDAPTPEVTEPRAERFHRANLPATFTRFFGSSALLVKMDQKCLRGPKSKHSVTQ